MSELVVEAEPMARRGNRGRVAARLPRRELLGGSSWMDRGKCVNTDVDLFYGPPWAQRMTEIEISTAKGYCSACPVQPQCLEWALAIGEHGIWGGISELERRELADQRAADEKSRQGAAGRPNSGKASNGARSVLEGRQRSSQGSGGRA